jgi:hypothetical protein
MATWAPTVEDLRRDVADLETYLSLELQNATEAERTAYWQAKIDVAVGELLEAARASGCPVPALPSPETTGVLREAALVLAARNANVRSGGDTRRGDRLRWAEGIVAQLRTGRFLTQETDADAGALIVLNSGQFP